MEEIAFLLPVNSKDTKQNVIFRSALCLLKYKLVTVDQLQLL